MHDAQNGQDSTAAALMLTQTSCARVPRVTLFKSFYAIRRFSHACPAEPPERATNPRFYFMLHHSACRCLTDLRSPLLFSSMLCCVCHICPSSAGCLHYPRRPVATFFSSGTRAIIR